MAEALFKHLVADETDFEVKSAGIAVAPGQQASPETVHVLNENGISVGDFRSQQATPELVDWATHIFAMTQGHLQALEFIAENAQDKAYLVTEFSRDDALRNADVPDPIGLGLPAYEETYSTLQAALPDALEFIKQTSPASQISSNEDSPQSTMPDAQELIVGADHGAFELKSALVSHLRDQGHKVNDIGTDTPDSVDYPDFAKEVSLGVLSGKYNSGILLCTSGIGMSIAANRHPGIQASLVTNEETAVVTRQHNDSNVLCLSNNDSTPAKACAIADAWLSTPFEGGRHGRRVNKMNQPNTPALGMSDPAVAEILQAEHQRQQNNIELIASENFASAAVREAQGSHLTNKYAEGYPGKRWYGGCEEVDKVETLAIERAEELFGAEYANVQPHSGSQANAAVYFSLIEHGDRILTMDLSHGGHLTHGHPANFSGKFYEVEHYGVGEDTGTIDYDKLQAQAEEFKPRMITAGASAYPRIIDVARMGQIAKSVGAILFVDMAHIAGLVAGGQHPSPMPHADVVTTTTHKSLRGPRGGLILTNSEEIAKKIDSFVFPGVQGGPLMHVIAAKAVCFGEALSDGFKEYQEQIVKNAAALAGRLVVHGYKISSGGTENHLMLVDLRPNGLNGKLAQAALDEAGITVNKNSIPFDTESPFKGGGVRIGTPAVTTRGMKEEEMKLIGDLIHTVLGNRKDKAKLYEVREQVQELNKRFPLPYR